MAFPKDSLTEGEQVVLHLHPHWKAMFWPAVFTLVAGGAVVAGLTLSWSPVLFYVVAAAAGVLFLVFGFWPYVVWRSTHYVFTNKHALYRKGVFTREERGISLTKISDVRYKQSLWERPFSAGTLTVESAGEEGQTHFVSIPHIASVTLKVKELVETLEDKRTLDDSEFRELLKEHREQGGAV